MLRCTAVWMLRIVLFSILINAGYAGSGIDPAKFDPFLQRALSQQSVDGPARSLAPFSGSEFPIASGYESGRLYDVVVFASDDILDGSGYHFNSRMDGFGTARLTATQLFKLAGHQGVRYIEKGGEMELQLDLSVEGIQADRARSGDAYDIQFTGRNTIIGVIDTGIDIFHPDFRDPVDTTKSRIISIWNVNLTPTDSESSPAGFDYGVEYTRADIESDLRRETVGRVRAIDTDGHGTHVAGIAGGNGAASGGRYTGVAPDAEFIIVQVPGSGIAQTWVIDGMTYIFNLAEELGYPAVVNMSFGGHGGAHDGTQGHELAIDQHAQLPGRAIAVAAGNSGEAGLHNGGTIQQGSTASFQVNIPQYQPASGNDNDYAILFLWYEVGAQDTLEVRVVTPSGYQVAAKRGGGFVEETDDGAVYLDSFGDFVNQKNGRPFLIEFFDQDSLKPPVVGLWTVQLRNLSSSNSIRYNVWRVVTSMSGVTIDPNTGRGYSVTMPGTAEYGITVASYATRVSWTDKNGRQWQFTNASEGGLSSWSGGGPTRDERIKPDITAPGQIIAAARSANASFSDQLLIIEPRYALLQGTSMAAPHITGVVSLIQQTNPLLTGVEIRQIIQRGGTGDALTAILPNQRWGYGKINTLHVFNHFDIFRDVPDRFTLYQNFPNPFNASTVIRFTVGEPTRGSLAVYDILGRKVETLVDGSLEPRIYYVPFDASHLSSGIYFYRLETERFSKAGRMVLIR